MNLRTFIERPVLSAVISITIVVVGIIGLFSLPVEQYPDIAPPTIMVSTTYYGASAETLQKSVIAPLEEAINGVEDMTYMTSTATNSGTVSITVYFKQGTDPDMAAVNVQNRVSRATGQLPAEVTRQVEIRVKYAGYLQRQEQQIEAFRREEARLLPEDADYASIAGLRLEARQKLADIRPRSIGQAGRISGVSPADIAVLLIWLSQRNENSTDHAE